MSQALDFLLAVWGTSGLPEEAELLLWTLPDRASRAHRDLGRAAAEAERLASRCDVYVGVGARRAGVVSQSVRGDSASVCALPALVADVDVAGPGHRKANLFASREAARDWLARLPLRPTAVIWSGGGFQVWWALKEPWILDTEEERRRAELLSRGWQQLLREDAARSGSDLDATWDLARVLRLPGTVNRKGGREVPVEAVALDGPRYDPGDLAEVVTEERLARLAREAEAGAEVAADSGALAVSADLEPPFQRFQDAADLNPKFLATWERRRRDLKDQSSSGHDQALANFAVTLGWSDQEVVSLLIAHRRKHGDDLRVEEERRRGQGGYYARTIRKAREALRVREVLAEADAARGLDDSEEARQKARATIEHYTGVAVDRVLRYGRDRSQYVLVLRGGTRVTMGDMKYLSRWVNWWQVAMEHGTPSVSAEPKATEWRATLGLLQLLQEVEEVEDATPEEETRDYLRRYSRAAPCLDDADGREVANYIETSRPFWRGGRLHVNLADLRQWVALTSGERLESKVLVTRLRGLGATAEGVSARTNGLVVSKRYWQLETQREVLSSSSTEDADESPGGKRVSGI